MDKVLLSKSEPNIAKKVTLLWKSRQKHPTCGSLNRSEVNQGLFQMSTPGSAGAVLGGWRESRGPSLFLIPCFISVPSSLGGGLLPGPVRVAWDPSRCSVLHVHRPSPGVLVTQCLVLKQSLSLFEKDAVHRTGKGSPVWADLHSRKKVGGSFWEYKIQLMVHGFFSICPLFVWKGKKIKRESFRAVTSLSSW